MYNSNFNCKYEVQATSNFPVIPSHCPTAPHCFILHLTQLKQMKELEQEKDSLLSGLEVVERAREWYQGQIHNVTERQRQVGQSSHCAPSFPSGGAQTAAVSTNSQPPAPAPPQAIQRLKDQNRLLTQVQHSLLQLLSNKSSPKVLPSLIVSSICPFRRYSAQNILNHNVRPIY
ncbi:hypothetical protein GOODEAATRI_000391 [Goodea atripinnis]|uniref:Suppressor APC domain containing 2 n=1 Tax=Goodea atripinnis TaxID=208336 RepID=A0ABV0PA46_9TELE